MTAPQLLSQVRNFPIVKSLAWQSGLRLIVMAMAVVKMKIIAQVLSPDAFGIAVTMLLVLGWIESGTETGVNTTLMQHQKNPQSIFFGALIVSIVRAIFICGALAFVYVWFFQSGGQASFALQSVFIAAIVVALVRGIIHPGIISWQRHLKFRSESMFRALLALVEVGALVVFFIVFPAQPAAIIWSLAAVSGVEVVTSWFFWGSKTKFSLSSAWMGITTIVKQMPKLTPAAFLSFATQNIDTSLVGFFLGQTLLGLYASAYSLSHKFHLEFTKLLQSALFPVFVERARAHQLAKKYFWGSFLATSVVSAVAALPFILWPRWLTLFFLGEKWLAIAPAVPILALAGVLQAAIGLLHTYGTANKRYYWLQVSLLSTLVFMGVGFWSGRPETLLAVSWIIFFSRVVAFPFLLIACVLPSGERDAKYHVTNPTE